MKDITKEFFKACSVCLGPGDFAHEKNFQLQHVMSAIDIMNPSMDVGMTKNKGILSFNEAINTGKLDPSQVFSLKDVVSVMDELFGQFVCWLCGDTLSQSVYSCMYMHCISLIENSHLSLFCEGLRRVVVLFRRTILTIPSFEDEDFSPSTFGIPVMSDTSQCFPDRKPNNSLFFDTDEQLLGKIETSVKSLSSMTDEIAKNVGDRLSAISAILRSSKCFNALFLALGDAYDDTYIFSGLTDYVKALNVNDDHQSAYLSFKDHIGDLLKHLISICNAIEPIEKKVFESSRVSQPQTTTVPGFELYVNVNVTSSVQKPPRKLNLILTYRFLLSSFLRARQVTEKLLQACSEDVVFFHCMMGIAHNLGCNVCHVYVDDLQASDLFKVETATCKSCVFSRAVLGLIMALVTKYPVEISDRISSRVELSSGGLQSLLSWLSFETSHIRHLIFRQYEKVAPFLAFCDHMHSLLSSVCRCYTFNRSRQRTNMEQLLPRLPLLIEDAAAVEAAISRLLMSTDANTFDVKLPRLHLTAYLCYLYYHFVWDYLVSGFQLSLYAVREWLYVYSLFISIQRNLSALVQNLIDELTVDSEEAGKVDNLMEKALTHQQQHQQSKKRRKKRENGSGGVSASKGVPASSRDTVAGGDIKREHFFDALSEDLPKSLKAPLDLCILSFQLAQSNAHRFMCLATMYVLQALHRDVGMSVETVNPASPSANIVVSSLDTQCRFYSSIRTQLLNRMQSLISTQYTPIVDAEGPDAFFESTHRHVTSEIFTKPETPVLYLTASFMFALAQQWFNTAISHETKSIQLGPFDSLNSLLTLAKKNEIACKILSSAPDRRPSGPSDYSRKDVQQPFLPVKLDFHYLSTCTYPLIAL